MLCDLEISRYTLSKHCLFSPGWCSYNLEIFITTCIRSLNYIIILLSFLHRLSLVIMKTIGLSTKFTDHQCVITWSILFTSWSSYLRSIWWTVYWKTSPYYRCVAVHAAYGTWSYCYLLLSGVINLQTNCPFWKPKLKTRYPLISHLFLCASCVWPLTLGSLRNDDGYIIGFTCRDFVVVVIE